MADPVNPAKPSIQNRPIDLVKFEAEPDKGPILKENKKELDEFTKAAEAEKGFIDKFAARKLDSAYREQAPKYVEKFDSLTSAIPKDKREIAQITSAPKEGQGSIKTPFLIPESKFVQGNVKDELDVINLVRNDGKPQFAVFDGSELNEKGMPEFIFLEDGMKVVIPEGSKTKVNEYYIQKIDKDKKPVGDPVPAYAFEVTEEKVPGKPEMGTVSNLFFVPKDSRTAVITGSYGEDKAMPKEGLFVPRKLGDG